MFSIPEYTDGYIEICEEQNSVGDFQITGLKKAGVKIWYRELAVYDRTKHELESDGMIVTAKIRIPMYKQIKSNMYCVFEGGVNQIYNVIHTTNKEGIRESELTLQIPKIKMEVVD